MDNLEDVIEQIVKEQTFTMEGVEAIKKLRDNLKAANKATEQLIKDKKEKEESYNSLRRVQQRSEIECKKHHTRENELLGREEKITELEKQTAVAEEGKRMLSYCFDKVFSNTIIREDIQKSVPLTRKSGDFDYVESQPATETKETTRE